MQKEETKFSDSTILEGMTSIRALLEGKKRGVNDRRILTVYYDETRMRKIGKTVCYLTARGKEQRFEVTAASSEQITEMTVGNTHGGIIALCSARTFPSLVIDDIIDDGFYVLLDGIEDPYNFGYALRSLYACGVDGILLRERNWMSAAGVVARASAGASELLPAYVIGADTFIPLFRQKGYQIVCADLNTEHMLGQTSLARPILLAIGGEKRGINAELLEQADVKVAIPYARDFEASLSAASAATIFGYEIMRQERKTPND